MDIKISEGEWKFKERVNGLIVQDGKVLILQMNHNGFYCCPGGHIHLGESSADAIKREMLEETKIETKPQKLLSVIENFFIGIKGEKVHEISFYYLLEPISSDFSKDDFSLIENDEGRIMNMEYRWVKFEELDSVDFRPQVLKQKLAKKDFDFEHIIFDQTK